MNRTKKEWLKASIPAVISIFAFISAAQWHPDSELILMIWRTFFGVTAGIICGLSGIYLINYYFDVKMKHGVVE